MDFELKPHTEAGVAFVTLAEKHAEEFAGRAEQFDRTNTFPKENITALQQSGYLAATVPRELGGLGVESAYDYALGTSRLARGDASTAITANMHLNGGFFLRRMWQAAKARGNATGAAPLEMALRAIASQQLVLTGVSSEPGSDLVHPLTEARRVPEGWVINGLKIFGTGSPSATMLGFPVKVIDAAGGPPQWGLAQVPCNTPGVEIQNDWDALGMRASGSHSIVFKNCIVPPPLVNPLALYGGWHEPFMAIFMPGNFGLVAGFLGIAEAAQALICETVKTKKKAPGKRTLAERPAIQRTIAENEIDLAACRAMIERTGNAIDRLFESHRFMETPMDVLHPVFKDFQCTKWLVNRKAVEVVDRAMTASGGAGYMSKNPLSRWYRDVRAGSFMQPLSPNEAFEYIGKVALGLDPMLDDWQP
jgi:alkylation response protein AidB-like acyl-CoA dehydrogenase